MLNKVIILLFISLSSHVQASEFNSIFGLKYSPCAEDTCAVKSSIVLYNDGKLRNQKTIKDDVQFIEQYLSDSIDSWQKLVLSLNKYEMEMNPERKRLLYLDFSDQLINYNVPKKDDERKSNADSKQIDTYTRQRISFYQKLLKEQEAEVSKKRLPLEILIKNKLNYALLIAQEDPIQALSILHIISKDKRQEPVKLVPETLCYYIVKQKIVHNPELRKMMHESNLDE